MNAERLLAHFEQISEAPDAVARLRRFILDLAVRGKLVEQDPEDEPAEELLRCIIKHKQGPLFNSKDQSPFPFNLPTGWVRTTLRSLVEASSSGWSPKALDTPREGDEWGILKVSAVSWDRFRPEANKQILPGTQPRPQAVIRKGDFLISRANTAELVARAVIVEIEPINLMMSDKIVRLELVELCESKYILINNNHSTFSRSYYAERATGASPSMKNVTRDVILDLPIPLPPLAEQHRIVAKVDELMALCDQLEAARQQREQTREHLVAASLQRLNQPAEDPASFRLHAQFALQTLPSLTTTPAQIKQLRQTILNLAVRGKLVEQQKNTVEQLNLFAALKADQLLALGEGAIKQKVAALSCLADESSFKESLESRVVNLASITTHGPQNGISPPGVTDPSAPKALTLSATTSGIFDANCFKHVNLTPDVCETYWPSSGDLLFQRGNTREYVGMAAVYDGPAC